MGLGWNWHRMITSINFKVALGVTDLPTWVVCCLYRHTLQWDTLQWSHNELDGFSNHQPHDCLLNCLFRRRSKKTLKLRVTGLYVGEFTGHGWIPAQKASNAGNFPIWWRRHEKSHCILSCIVYWDYSGNNDLCTLFQFSGSLMWFVDATFLYFTIVWILMRS